MRERREHVRDRFADYINHHQPGEQAGEQRDDQNRFQCFKALRQRDITTDRLRRVTGDKPGDDPADKPGAQGTRQQTADHPRRQARTVGNRIGDVPGQQRHHQLERGFAADLHQRCRQRAFFLEAVMPNTNDKAIIKPPATTIGSMNDTPVSRCL